MGIKIIGPDARHAGETMRTAKVLTEAVVCLRRVTQAMTESDLTFPATDELARAKALVSRLYVSGKQVDPETESLEQVLNEVSISLNQITALIETHVVAASEHTGFAPMLGKIAKVQRAITLYSVQRNSMDQFQGEALQLARAALENLLEAFKGIKAKEIQYARKTLDKMNRLDESLAARVKMGELALSGLLKLCDAYQDAVKPKSPRVKNARKAQALLHKLLTNSHAGEATELEDEEEVEPEADAEAESDVVAAAFDFEAFGVAIGNDIASVVLGKIDLMYPEMWKAVPKSARAAIRNAIRNRCKALCAAEVNASPAQSPESPT